ncbi:adrenodoxin-like isoform X1 [Tubulanus polymorphus]|uniref:adrenodoxin-like isoform X1 n=1 Tax=Tubulanus polymorphus TaxID=672921 RepID=UPI003DA32BA2
MALFCGRTISRLCVKSTQSYLRRGALIQQQNQQLHRRLITQSTALPKEKPETVTIYFRDRDGDLFSAKANIGDNLLTVAIDNDIELEGACEGTLACSTCHLIFKKEDYNQISDKPSDEELDMLDLAYGLEDTSRLGCQVYVQKDMDGWEIKVPDAVADARDV